MINHYGKFVQSAAKSEKQNPSTIMHNFYKNPIPLHCHDISHDMFGQYSFTPVHYSILVSLC